MSNDYTDSESADSGRGAPPPSMRGDGTDRSYWSERGRAMMAEPGVWFWWAVEVREGRKKTYAANRDRLAGKYQLDPLGEFELAQRTSFDPPRIYGRYVGKQGGES